MKKYHYEIELTPEFAEDGIQRIYVQTNCSDLRNNRELLAKAINSAKEEQSFDLEHYENYGKITVHKNYVSPELIDID